MVTFPFAAPLLTRGKNTVTLRHANSDHYEQGDEIGESGPGPGYVMYDAIRLEVPALIRNASAQRQPARARRHGAREGFRGRSGRALGARRKDG